MYNIQDGILLDKIEPAGDFTFIYKAEGIDKSYLITYWGSLEEPLFKATLIAGLIDYSAGKTNHMLELVEDFEKVLVPFDNLYVDGKKLRDMADQEAMDHIFIFRAPSNPGEDFPLSASDRRPKSGLRLSKRHNYNPVWFLTEDGLYEVLMRSTKPISKHLKSFIKRKLHEDRIKGNGELRFENGG